MRKSRHVMGSPVTTAPSRSVTTEVGRWGVAALWATLPVAAGPAFAEALDATSRPVQIVSSVGLWGVWAVALGAALVPRTSSLTVVRIIVPASVPAVVWAAWATADTNGAATSVLTGGVIALVATLLVLSSITGDVFVNGSSYGDERRMPLRPPAALLIGPLELAWMVCVAGAVSGPLLLAAQVWVGGALALAIGWPATWMAARALHGLSQRWLVFVPAGVVIHDLMAVSEPVLMPRRLITSLAPALAGTNATDLTSGSRGILLQVDLAEPIGITPALRRTRPGQRPSLESIEVASLLVAPTRPGAVMREARSRRVGAN